MKKLISVLLVLTLVLSLGTTAFAAEADLSDHTYVAYQIFSGTQAEGSNELGNVAWGSGVNGDALLTALKADTTLGATFSTCTTAADVAVAMKDWSDASNEAKAFAKLAYANKTGDGIECESGVTPLNAGYYLVVDTTDVSGEYDVKNLALLQLTNKGTFEIANKTDVPEVEKKVKDTNDSVADSTTDWQDSADYDIGDAVPFQLTATLADNVSAYDTYKVVFHDTLSDGLTYNNDAKVFFGGTDVTTYFDITEDNGVLTISCDDVKAFKATDSSVITVEYTATLNENAVIGSDGNPNEVYLEYSNNPNWIPEGETDEGPTGNTPKDKVIVFTYKVIVNKTDEQDNPLAGAGFTLYKKNNAGAWIEVSDNNEDEGNEISGDDLTTFTWTGLDDGDYKLVETTTPDGYNTIAPIEFKVEATHEEEADEPQLVELTGGNKFTGDVNTGALTGDVINQSGATLPETGGMGTTMFYIIGGLMAAAAVVLLVTKKRMHDAA